LLSSSVVGSEKKTGILTKVFLNSWWEILLCVSIGIVAKDNFTRLANRLSYACVNGRFGEKFVMITGESNLFRVSRLIALGLMIVIAGFSYYAFKIVFILAA